MNLKERYLAIREGHFNAASQEYFAARPQLDTPENRRIFYAGHCKGYDTVILGVLEEAGQAALKPIDMLLYCPNCGVQHIDKPDLCETCPGGNCMCVMQAERWTNPPHRSHLCANPDCGCIWRPADVPTNGVEAINTVGQSDSWPVPHNEEVTAAIVVRHIDRPATVVGVPEAKSRVSEVHIDAALNAVVPGGSTAKDWFLPHETERGEANVREVVRLMIEATLKREGAPRSNSLVTVGYNDKGESVLQASRTSFDPSKDHSVAECALLFREAVVVRKQTNIDPLVLWKHIMGYEWEKP